MLEKVKGSVLSHDKALKDYERGYEELARRIRKEEDGTYSRSELPERYTAKLLYR